MVAPGWAWERGLGLDADPSLAVGWYRRAMDAGETQVGPTTLAARVKALTRKPRTR